MGNKATREFPANLGKFASSVEAWNHRLQVGIDGGAGMYANTNRFGRDRVLKMYADWTDRIAGGEYPQQAPPRPQGAERNFVITVWDWADDRQYFHDAVASDKRNPAINANGPVFGVHENSSDFMSILDPMQHKATQVTIPVLDEKLAPLPGEDRRPVAVLGRGNLLEHARHRAQQRHGSEGSAVEHLARASAGRPAGVLQGRVESPLREALPAQHERPAVQRLRPDRPRSSASSTPASARST